MRHVKPHRSFGILLLLAALLARAEPTALAGQARTAPAPASSKIETAILRGDWSSVIRLSDSGLSLAPVVRHLVKAHALLALNRGNEALCLFSATPTPEELTRWESWARGMTTHHPRSAAGYYLLGDALARQKKWPEAFGSFQASLDRDPSFALTLNARGVGFAVTGDVGRALVDLQGAAAINPLLGDVYLNKGYAYIQSHVATGARTAFNRALQLMPESSLAIGGLGYVQVVENKWADGKLNIEAAGRRSPCLSPGLANNLASIAEWQAQTASTHIASADTQDLGTTLRSLLTRVGQGDRAAMQAVNQFAVDHPEFQKQIQMTEKNMYDTNPAVRKPLAEEIAKFSAQAQQRADQLSTVDTLKSQASAGLDLKGVKLGAQVEIAKSGSKLQEQAAKAVQFAKDLEKAVPASKEQLGGVTTDMTHAALDKGHWPIEPHYTLSYSARVETLR